MSDTSAISTVADPFEVLGLPSDATDQQIRASYLDLVKQFPPEREPDKFRQIQAAFSAASDPLVLAKSMLELPDEDDPPSWQSAIDAQSQRRPAMPVEFLLSLGNQSKSRTGKVDTKQDDTLQQNIVSGEIVSGMAETGAGDTLGAGDG